MAIFDAIHKKTLGKLTDDPLEQRNVVWLTVSTLLLKSSMAMVMLSAFLTKAGYSDKEIGWVVAANQIAFTGGMFLLMGLADRIQRRIAGVMYTAIVAALLYVVLGGVTALPTGLLSPLALLAILGGAVVLQQPISALGSMLEYSAFVRTIQATVRGKVWGITEAVGSLLLMLMGLAAALILSRFGFPYGFSVCFVLAAVILVLRGLTFGKQTELPSLSVPGHSRSLSPFVAAWDMFKLPKFRLVAYPHILRGILMGLAAFIVPTALRQFNLPSEYAGYMTALSAGAAVLGAVLFGLTNDRLGSGPVTLCAEIVIAGAWAGLAFAGSPLVFLASLVLYGIGDVMEANSIPLGAFEIMPAEVMGAFSAARLMILAGATALGSLASGYLLDYYTFLPVFAVAAVLKLVLGVWFFKVLSTRKKQPEAKPESA